MTTERLVRQVVNMVMRSIIAVGIGKGIDYATRRGKPADQLTRQEKDRARTTKAAAGRMRQAIRVLRRFIR